MFRVCQEALTNIVRHAQATTARISASRGADAVVLRVTDDGIGFRGQTGSGIEGMKERALLVDGVLSVRGQSGKGTEVTLTIPTEPREALRAPRPPRADGLLDPPAAPTEGGS